MPSVLKFLTERGIKIHQVDEYPAIFHDYDGKTEHELIAAIERRFPFIEARPYAERGKRSISLESKSGEDHRQIEAVTNYIWSLKNHEQEHEAYVASLKGWKER